MAKYLGPICRACGEHIPRGASDTMYDWKQRKYHQVSTDLKEKKCAYSKPKTVRELKDQAAEKRAVTQKKRLSEAEIEALDAAWCREKAALSDEIDRRHGYGHSQVRILSAEEIQALAPILTPPTEGLPEYRPFVVPFKRDGSCYAGY